MTLIYKTPLMKFIKKYRFAISIIIVIVAFFILSPIVLPKYSKRLMLISVLMLFELYCWTIIKKGFPKLFNRKLLNAIVFIVFWLPFFCILSLIAVGLVYPVHYWVPPLFVYFFGGLVAYYASKLLLLFFLLLSEIIFLLNILFKWIFKKDIFLHNKLRRPFIKIGFSLGIVLFTLIVLGNFFWIYNFRVHKVELSFPNLPKEFDGLKIVQISDIHLGSMISEKPMKDAVKIIDSLHPDMIFFTGDLVNNYTDEAYRFEDILNKVKAPMGVYSILGNHDYGDYIPWDSPEAKEKNLQDLINFQKRIGWNLLLNQNIIIQRDSSKIAVIGIENWSESKHFPKKGNITKALLHTNSIPFKLLLSHDPTAWGPHITFENNIDITFSGHTHGMQFGIETKSFRWSPAAWIYRYWADLAEREDSLSIKQYLYVNTGLGCVGIPSRVGILPEITLFTLHHK